MMVMTVHTYQVCVVFLLVYSFDVRLAVLSARLFCGFVFYRGEFGG